MKLPLMVSTTPALLVLLACSPVPTHGGPAPPASANEPRTSRWVPFDGNPVISARRPPEGLPRSLAEAPLLIWNDPSVV
ncbi:MAG: hypothetical protein R3344_10130, partial [Acidobacteriota bacterium]|nr:hypothetical protein [Acidobacteriota bacterium]